MTVAKTQIKKEATLQANSRNVFASALGKHKVFYSFKFASIISPGAIMNVRLLQETFESRSKANKLIVKQSYMLLTWVLYLRDTTQGLTDKQIKELKKPSFFIYPKRQYKFTHTKAPMAHKTFSQEQYMFRFYYISVTFKLKQDVPLTSVNESILFALMQRQIHTFYGTNLFFMRRVRMRFNSVDSTLLRLI